MKEIEIKNAAPWRQIFAREDGTLRIINILTQKEKITRGYLMPNGYYTVANVLNTSTVGVHRLIALAFLDNPNNLPEVNHKNGQKDDNRSCNLEWVSTSQNQKHSFASGLNKSKKYALESRDLNIYNFYNYVTGEQFIGTKQEFRKRYRDYDNQIRSLFLKNNSIKSWKGWTLDPDYEYTRKGEYNPQADTNIYTFYNPEKQLEFTGTRYEFQDKYNLWGTNLGSLFHKNAQKSLKGWTLIKNYKHTKAGLANPKADKTVYTFCHKDGNTFIGTRADFCNNYNFRPSQIRGLFLTINPRKSYKGWSLDFAKASEIIYTFYHKNGDIFTGTRADLAKKYNLSKEKLNPLFRTIPKQVAQGWSLTPTPLNNNSDNTIYLFRNSVANLEFVGTRCELTKAFPDLDIRPLFATRSRKSHKGWQCLACYI